MIALIPFLVQLLLQGTHGVSDERVVISPTAPGVGDHVTVVYHTTLAPDAFQKANDVMLEVYTSDKAYYPEGFLTQYPMVKDGADWTATFVIADTQANAMFFRFTSDDLVDDNDNNVWSSLVHGRDGKPVRSAHFSVSWLYSYGIGSFKRERNPKMNMKELETELSLYPDNFSAAQWRWTTFIRNGANDSIRTIVHREIDKFYEKARGNDSLMSYLPSVYELAGDSTLAREIRKEGIAKNPRGYVAFQAETNEAMSMKDPGASIRLLRKMLLEFAPLSPDRTQSIRSFLASYAIRAGKFDIALEAVSGITPPSCQLFEMLAKEMLKRGDQLETAAYVAAKCVELNKNPDMRLRRNFKTEKEWKESLLDACSMDWQVIGDIYVKRGKPDSAVAAFEEAYALSRGEDSDIAHRYVVALGVTGRYGKAVQVGMDAVAHAQGTDSLITEMKHSFAAMNGGSAFGALPPSQKEDFAGMLEGARKKMSATMRLKVEKSRISQPEIDFTLADLSGRPVHLASLRGKVVVMDFWATWCGPCRESFPILQRVCDKFRNNPSVVIMAIDSWERLPDSAAIILTVRKFQSDNKYTWQVLVDNKNEVATRYGVTGIPARFIVDRRGTLAFKSIGFSGPDMEEEMVQQIEILLAELPAGSQ